MSGAFRWVAPRFASLVIFSDTSDRSTPRVDRREVSKKMIFLDGKPHIGHHWPAGMRPLWTHESRGVRRGREVSCLSASGVPVRSASPPVERRAGAPRIDQSRRLELWATGLPVGRSWRINELPIPGNTDVSRSAVPSTQPATAGTTRRSNPGHPGAINDVDQLSHLMIKQSDCCATGSYRGKRDELPVSL
jgi:hypothetical protein